MREGHYIWVGSNLTFDSGALPAPLTHELHINTVGLIIILRTRVVCAFPETTH